MPKVAQQEARRQEKLNAEKTGWWTIEHLVAGIDASPAVKYFLTLVHLHTNARKKYAWTQQKNLAVEMSCSLITVKRAVAWTKKVGVVQYRRVRTGKNPKDQYNEYWLDVEQLKKLQRKPSEQGSPVTPVSDEQGSPAIPVQKSNTSQIRSEQVSNPLRTGITSEPIGFQVVQETRKTGDNHHPHFVVGGAASSDTKQKADDEATLFSDSNSKAKSHVEKLRAEAHRDPNILRLKKSAQEVDVALDKVFENAGKRPISSHRYLVEGAIRYFAAQQQPSKAELRSIRTLTAGMACLLRHELQLPRGPSPELDAAVRKKIAEAEVEARNSGRRLVTVMWEWSGLKKFDSSRQGLLNRAQNGPKTPQNMG